MQVKLRILFSMLGTFVRSDTSCVLPHTLILVHLGGVVVCFQTSLAPKDRHGVPSTLDASTRAGRSPCANYKA